MKSIPASAIALALALLTSACISIQTTPSNSRPDRPEIYMFEGQGAWIGFGRALPAGAHVALHGPGWNSANVVAYKTDQSITECEFPSRSARSVLDNAASIERKAAAADLDAANAIESTLGSIDRILNTPAMRKTDRHLLRKLKRLLGRSKEAWRATSDHLHTDAADYLSYAERLAPPVIEGHRICKSNVGARIIGIMVTPTTSEGKLAFDGTEAICIGGAGIRGCSRPAKQTGYRQVRVSARPMKAAPSLLESIETVIDIVADEILR